MRRRPSSTCVSAHPRGPSRSLSRPAGSADQAQVNRGMIARRALELFLETHEAGPTRVSTAAMEVIVAHNRVPHCSGLFLTAVNRRCPFRTRCYVQLSELSYCRHHAKFCDSPQDGSRWRAWCGEPGVSAAASSPRMARPPAVMLAVPTWEASPWRMRRVCPTFTCSGGHRPSQVGRQSLGLRRLRGFAADEGGGPCTDIFS